jgi:hypothetical protein
VEIRRSIEQVEQDIHLLHQVASRLILGYDEQELGAKVDALADALAGSVIAAKREEAMPTETP